MIRNKVFINVIGTSGLRITQSDIGMASIYIFEQFEDPAEKNLPIMAPITREDPPARVRLRFSII